jgi:hypothetical protein
MAPFISPEQTRSLPNAASPVAAGQISVDSVPGTASTSVSESPPSTIFSLGPHSDAVIDTFSLSDTLIPRLRILVGTTRQNKWLQVLQNEYGLEAASALALSNALKAIASSTGDEYDALTVEEKEALIVEFEEYKAGEATGKRVTNRSRVNNVTYTVGMVEKEVKSCLIFLNN